MQRFGGRQEIALSERKNVGAIERKERETPVKLRQFVEIESKHEYPVEKSVVPRREPLVHHVTLIKTGIHALGEDSRLRS